MSDLDEFPTTLRSYFVYRLARIPNIRTFISKMRISAVGEQEVVSATMNAGRNFRPQVRLNNLLDMPFAARDSRKPIHSTRYSDGSHRVFYSSLDIRTAERETISWAERKFIGRPSRDRKLHYDEFSCNFTGKVRDISESNSLMNKLTDPDDYRYCNQLGTDAVSLGLDGLVVPSARCSGKNLPVFARPALSSPRRVGFAVLVWRQETKKITLEKTTDLRAS